VFFHIPFAIFSYFATFEKTGFFKKGWSYSINTLVTLESSCVTLLNLSPNHRGAVIKSVATTNFLGSWSCFLKFFCMYLKLNNQASCEFSNVYKPPEMERVQPLPSMSRVRGQEVTSRVCVRVPPCGSWVRVWAQHCSTLVHTRVLSSQTRVLRPPIPKCYGKFFLLFKLSSGRQEA
jgi:hypothetical protein